LVEVEIERGWLIVRVLGLHKLWALRSRLEFPLAHVGWIETDFEIARMPLRGIRAGTAVPGVIRAGYYYADDGWSFWDVSDPDGAVVVYLRSEPLAKLVIEVGDPYETVTRVRLAQGRG
jgi:hypothetical protein